MKLTRTHSLGVKCEKINGDGQWVPTNTKNSTEISLSELNDFGDTVDSRCLEFPVEPNFYRSPELRCV